MIPLLVLLIVTGIAFLMTKKISGLYNFPFSARTGMSAMLLFTAMGHFLFTEGMALMIPGNMPFKYAIVYGTAILEIIAAIGLHIPKARKLTAWLLILFFLLVLPANVKASMEHLNYQAGTFDGPGPGYLWFRLPLQLFFMGWVYFSSVKFG